MTQQSLRFTSPSVALERERTAQQNAAMHHAIAEQNSSKIRAIRYLIENILNLRNEGCTYREIAEELADDFVEFGIDIPAQHVPSAIGAAVRAEKANEHDVTDMIDRIDAAPSLRERLLATVDEQGGYGVLRDPELKEALVRTGVLTSRTAQGSKQERSIFRTALMSVHYRRMKWLASRGRA